MRVFLNNTYDTSGGGANLFRQVNRLSMRETPFHCQREADSLKDRQGDDQKRHNRNPARENR